MRQNNQYGYPIGAPYPIFQLRDVQNKCQECGNVYVGASVESCPKCAPRADQAMGLPEFLAQAKPMMDAVDSAFSQMFRRPVNLSLPHERVTLGRTEYCVAGTYRKAQGNRHDSEYVADAIWDANDKNAQDLLELLTDGMIDILETLALVAYEARLLEDRIDVAEHRAQLMRDEKMEAA